MFFVWIWVWMLMLICLLMGFRFFVGGWVGSEMDLELDFRIWPSVGRWSDRFEVEVDQMNFYAYDVI